MVHVNDRYNNKYHYECKITKYCKDCSAIWNDAKKPKCKNRITEWGRVRIRGMCLSEKDLKMAISSGEFNSYWINLSRN